MRADKFDKFFVVVGTIRGGTSAMMSAIRWCGIPVAGYRYPMVVKSKKGIAIPAGSAMPLDDEEPLNPTGLWEINGVTRGGLNEHTRHFVDGLVLKIVDSDFIHSDSGLMCGAICIVRNPRETIRSQISLTGEKRPDNSVGRQLTAWVLGYNFYRMMHYIRGALLPMRIVVYENLLKDPVKEMERVCKFIGRGEPQFASEVISNRHKHSQAILDKGKAFDFIDTYYKLCLDNDIEGIMKQDYGYVRCEIEKLFLELNKEEEC